mgnify:CR=1 FL=1
MLSLLKAKVEFSRLIRDWRFWSEAIGKAAEKALGSCKIYLFGSIAEGYMGGSDVDILIVADRLPRDFRVRGELKARIEEEAGLPLCHPFEMHLVTCVEVEANPIYKRAIGKGVAILSKELEKRS